MIQLDRIHLADVLDGLRSLPDACVDCVMTSPPYWATRDYRIPRTTWSDGSVVHLGLEPTVESYVGHLLEVFEEVKRVLKPTGTCWVNLADTYSGSWGGYSREETVEHRTPFLRAASAKAFRPPTSLTQRIPLKSLCLIPERFALGMVERGWVLRNRVVWSKTNALPSGAKDRLTPRWENILFFAKSRRYHFDLDAVRVPPTSRAARAPCKRPAAPRTSLHVRGHRLPPRPDEVGGCHPLGKNPGDVWTLPTARLPTGHPAGYPEALCRIPITAGCPPGGVVLDPFMGSGTTAVVARSLGRRFLGFELNAEYIRAAEDRLEGGRHAA